MRALAGFLLLIAASTTLASGSIRVSISNLQNNAGKVICSLFDSKEAFLIKPILSIEFELNSSSTPILQFDHIENGIYGISCIHDENNNDELDTNFLGIPTEAVGSSNNPASRFGPPSFDDAKFKFEDKEVSEIEVEMNTVF